MMSKSSTPSSEPKSFGPKAPLFPPGAEVHFASAPPPGVGRAYAVDTEAEFANPRPKPPPGRVVQGRTPKGSEKRSDAIFAIKTLPKHRASQPPWVKEFFLFALSLAVEIFDELWQLAILVRKAQEGSDVWDRWYLFSDKVCALFKEQAKSYKEEKIQVCTLGILQDSGDHADVILKVIDHLLEQQEVKEREHNASRRQKLIRDARSNNDEALVRELQDEALTDTAAIRERIRTTHDAYYQAMRELRERQTESGNLLGLTQAETARLERFAEWEERERERDSLEGGYSNRSVRIPGYKYAQCSLHPPVSAPCGGNGPGTHLSGQRSDCPHCEGHRAYSRLLLHQCLGGEHWPSLGQACKLALPATVWSQHGEGV